MNYRLPENIAGFQCHAIQIDQNKNSKPFNRLSLESGNRKKVDMQTLAKIQVKAIFLMGDMRRNSKNICH